MTLRFLSHEMFDSLRHWTGQTVPEHEIPIDATIGAMDHAGVGFGLLSAWHAPREGALISNDEVAAWVAAHPNRFAGLAAADLAKPMKAVRELRRCVTEVGFKGLRVVPWLWEAPPELVSYMKTGSGQNTRSLTLTRSVSATTRAGATSKATRAVGSRSIDCATSR